MWFYKHVNKIVKSISLITKSINVTKTSILPHTFFSFLASQHQNMDSDSDSETMELSLDPALKSSQATTSDEFHLVERVKSSQATTSDEFHLVERVCQYLKTQKTDTKTFLLAYLRSGHASIIKRRKQWGSVKQGWKTTEQVLDEIENVVNQKPDCRLKWNEWVLKKAKYIVAQQSLPKSALYININNLNTSFFSHEHTLKREEVAVKNSDFLYQLITFKLEHGHLAWKAERNRRTMNHSGACADSDSSDSDADPASPPNDSLQIHQFRKSNNKVKRAKDRLSAVRGVVSLDRNSL
ncbi:hypothetical protein DFH28DRAFT_1172804 [Melampsora americana]|nr:hypothetical protein DFH28DRAFT_1115476 [Melampsora americana]KAH9823342.1 hypothetical protein DFH28DRAFT_1172804 [Melampsora americana]